MRKTNYQCWVCQRTASELTDYLCPRCYELVDLFAPYHANHQPEAFFAKISPKLSAKYYYGCRPNQD